MVEIPFSPTACALVTTMTLVLTFYAGRWWGMKMTMNLIEEEMTRYECEEREEE